MGFNRPEAKMRARASIRGTYPHPALVTLIYFLLTTVLTNVIMAFVSDPFQTAYLYLMDGVYAPERIFQTIFTPGRVGLYLVLQILISLYTCVMQFGYTSYALRLSRWEQPGYRNLMDGFAVVGRVIGINLLIAIFVWLWTMLAMIPYMIVMVIAAVSQSAGLMVLAVLLAIVGTIFGVSVSYRYRLALYFMLDPSGLGRDGVHPAEQADHEGLEVAPVCYGPVLPGMDDPGAAHLWHPEPVGQPLSVGQPGQFLQLGGIWSISGAPCAAGQQPRPCLLSCKKRADKSCPHVFSGEKGIALNGPHCYLVRVGAVP